MNGRVAALLANLALVTHGFSEAGENERKRLLAHWQRMNARDRGLFMRQVKIQLQQHHPKVDGVPPRRLIARSRRGRKGQRLNNELLKRTQAAMESLG